MVTVPEGMITDEQIDLIEHLRERSDFFNAIKNAKVFLEDAKKSNDYYGYSRILAHLILCYQLLFERNGQQLKHIQNMEKYIYEGLKLPLPDEDKAVFYLRHGVYYIYTGNYVAAEQKFKTAYCNVQKNDYMQWEYLGHYAHVQSLNANHLSAFCNLRRAIKQIIEITSMRDWHKNIVLAGLYRRILFPAMATFHWITAIKAFISGIRLAYFVKNEQGYHILWDKVKRLKFNT